MKLQDANLESMAIVGISGSLREMSYTRFAVNIALQAAKEMGANIQLIDLRDYNLPYCDGDESSYPDDVFQLRKTVQLAHGIILGTPEYHGSYSGVLKNALDLMGFEEFEGKMMGLIGVSGGAMGAVDALNSLRNVSRSLHAWVVPQQVAIPNAWKFFDKTGKVNDEDLEKRLIEVGKQVAHFAKLHNFKQASEFLQSWETATPNPGGAER